jgi:hypothetical protein
VPRRRDDTRVELRPGTRDERPDRLFGLEARPRRSRHRGELLGHRKHATLHGDRVAAQHARESAVTVPALAAVQDGLHHAVEVLDAREAPGIAQVACGVAQHAHPDSVERETLRNRLRVRRDGRAVVLLRRRGRGLTSGREQPYRGAPVPCVHGSNIAP